MLTHNNNINFLRNIQVPLKKKKKYIKVQNKVVHTNTYLALSKLKIVYQSILNFQLFS